MSTAPPAVKDATIRAVAVLLCKTVVTPTPARKARIRVLNPIPRIQRKSLPKAR
jgi:hypothetical protein